MLAYHSDSKIKSKYVRRMEAHRKADELVQGTGWESNGVTRGCAVGCLFHAYDHKRGPVEIGVPEVLLRLEDAIFEGLPKKDAMAWPTAFLKAIPVGADLSRVHYAFCAWLMLESGLLTITDGNRKAILDVGALNQLAASGDQPVQSAWYAAESAARSAAWSAARSAARSAAESAAESAARSAAWSAAWQKMAAKLLELLAASQTTAEGR